MKKDKYIAEIKDGDKVDSLFLVARKDLGVSKAGKPYLALRLIDKSGEIEARVWDGAEAIAEGFLKDEVVAVKGHALLYKDKIQLNLTDVASVAKDSYSIGDFLPASVIGPEKMIEELEEIISGVKNSFVKKLLGSFLSDPVVRERFMYAPAAKGMHHSYISGLLEHVLSLAKLSRVVCAHYKNVDSDVVLAGLILHDIGKTRELAFDKSFDYTDEGRLIGHISIGIEMIDEKVRSIDGFPPSLALHIKHIILSHHGMLEFGSPKRPKTLEALIVSALDDLDAKLNAFEGFIKGDTGSGEWTEYHRLFERYIYRGFYKTEGSEFTEPEKKAETPTRRNLELFNKKNKS